MVELRQSAKPLRMLIKHLSGVSRLLVLPATASLEPASVAAHLLVAAGVQAGQHFDARLLGYACVARRAHEAAALRRLAQLVHQSVLPASAADDQHVLRAEPCCLGLLLGRLLVKLAWITACARSEHQLCSLQLTFNLAVQAM